MTNAEGINSTNEISYLDAAQLVYGSDFIERHPVDYCNKAIVLRAESWGAVQNYTHDLENYIKYQCK